VSRLTDIHVKELLCFVFCSSSRIGLGCKITFTFQTVKPLERNVFQEGVERKHCILFSSKEIKYRETMACGFLLKVWKCIFVQIELSLK